MRIRTPAKLSRLATPERMPFPCLTPPRCKRSWPFKRAATCAWQPILTTSASEPREKSSAVRPRKRKLSSVSCCRSLTTSNAGIYEVTVRRATDNVRSLDNDRYQLIEKKDNKEVYRDKETGTKWVVEVHRKGD